MGVITNWFVGNSEVITRFYANKMQLTSNFSKYNYQLLTNPIKTNVGKSYQVKLTGELIQGGMLVGILANNKFLTTEKLQQNLKYEDSIILNFASNAKEIQLLITNNNAQDMESIINLEKVELFSLNNSTEC